ncbi:UxaA family hydrolase [Haladaptatus sp. DYSN1]|uniref:UxaA family hydrolase n=1 Tax=unclassified Haladaptatus TaxID=2622732 RepID=UPI002404F1DE|nr:UxaA family hydrolase [Haladaptatus sp. DYSN1]
MKSAGTVRETEGAVQFEAFDRGDGRIGVRNRVLVLPSVICSHMVADRIAASVPDAVSTPHDHGCAQIGSDNDQTRRTFLGIGTNPNIAGTVVVGLGCEVIQSDSLAADLAARGVPVSELSIQGVGGTDECVEQGIELVEELKRSAHETERGSASLGDLTVGIVCSDLSESSVETAEPLVGEFTDAIVDAGGRVVVAGSERITTHGDEAVAAAANEETAAQVEALLSRHRDLPPKASHLAAASSGTSFDRVTGVWGDQSAREVVEYGDQVTIDSGLALLDAPSNFEEAATGLAAAGAQLVVHVTADGIPAGHPIVPVLKVSGDVDTVAALPDDIDIDATTTDLDGLEDRVRAIANGDPCCAENHGLTEFAITRVGPSM